MFNLNVTHGIYILFNISKMGNFLTRFCIPEYYYKQCDFCYEKISNKNPYMFDIYGLGKHDGKTICTHCLQEKLNK